MMVSNDGASKANDLVGLLVEGNADHEDPVVRAMHRLEARERLPDPVGRMADIDHGQRILSITSMRPGQRASRRPDRTAASVLAAALSRPRPSQPEQEQ